jgi:uncharacterized repeat protein (TIGR01451 family)
MGISDLSIIKTRPCSVANPGSTLTYTVEVSNFGPNDAPDVIVTDFLPADFSFISASGTDWTFNVVGQTLTATNPLITVGETSIFTITGLVTSTQPGSLINIAEVQSANLDPDLSNNTTFDEIALRTESPIASAIRAKLGCCPTAVG